MNSTANATSTPHLAPHKKGKSPHKKLFPANIMAPAAGLEPTTKRLTAARSTN
jgi:hypothetical protein